LLALLPLAVFGLSLHAYSSTPLSWALPWIPSLGIDFSFRLDGLAMLFVLLISGIGSLVFVYASSYLGGVPQRGRLFLFLSLFMFAMLGAVSSDEVFLLFCFWELTSITSFLLVGFDHNSDKARQAARQALFITGGGGLALLAGLILLTQIAGTSSITTMLATSSSWNQHPLVPLALLGIFVGAFTKSAQYPFHFWLPGAMAAPTPVSAYLHSATMVKLGIYLLARLHPAFESNAMWQLVLVSVGAFTSLWAMILTVRERDLKRILAWSTVSALGTLVMLIGLPGEGAATATAAFLLAHALYKAPLFFVAGNVDLSTGTRVIDNISGLGRRLPVTAVAAWLAGLSMAGIPLSFGCVAKDVIKLAKNQAELFNWVAYVGVFVSAASVAAAGVAAVRVFWPWHRLSPPEARKDRWLTAIPPMLVALLGVLFGFYPSLVHTLITDAALAMGSSSSLMEMRELSDPAARNSAVGLTLVLGVILFMAWDKLHVAQKGVPTSPVLKPSDWYRGYLLAVPWLARRVTALMQSGHLRSYSAMVLGFSLLTLLLALLSLEHAWIPSFELENGPVSWAMAGVLLMIVVSSVLVCVLRNPFVMLLVSGMIGLASAILFLFMGAADVALTQLTVEVAFVVVLAAILLRLRKLELVGPARLEPWQTVLRAVFSISVGVSFAVLLLIATAFEPYLALEQYFMRNAVDGANGRNVVNVILVDFRALDTLGEIIVVTFTFLSSVVILRLLRRALPEPEGAGEEDCDGGERCRRCPPLLAAATRWLYPLMLLGAAFLLLRGHNAPGGGFIAGMVAVAATAMLAVSRGSRYALGRLPLKPVALASASVLLSLLSGVPALFMGLPYMTHPWFELELWLTSVDVSTVLLFDLGVFGAVWASLGTIAARAIDVDVAPSGGSEAPARRAKPAPGAGLRPAERETSSLPEAVTGSREGVKP
jgi:multicomponent Na+:H+ antiporter subunit A